MTLLAALRQAAVQAWTGQGPPPLAAAPENPAKTSQRVVRNPDPDDPWTGSEAPEKPAKTGQADEPKKPAPPAWVNAPAKMDDNCYTTSVHVRPLYDAAGMRAGTAQSAASGRVGVCRVVARPATRPPCVCRTRR